MSELAQALSALGVGGVGPEGAVWGKGQSRPELPDGQAHQVGRHADDDQEDEPGLWCANGDQHSSVVLK